MRIVGLNIQHGGGIRGEAIATVVAALRPDVVVLSEFHPNHRGDGLLGRLADDGLPFHAAGVPPDPVFPNTVCIVSAVPIESVRHPLEGSANGHRVVEARVGGILVAGVYFPLGRPKVAFWRQEFLPYARARLDEAALLIGDWNSGSHFLDEAGATLDGAPEFEAMSAMGWTDVWRTTHPDEREFTWFSKPHGNGFRLDHGFVSSALLPFLDSACYAHGTRQPGISDHSGLVVDLRLPNPPGAP